MHLTQNKGGTGHSGGYGREIMQRYYGSRIVRCHRQHLAADVHSDVDLVVAEEQVRVKIK